MSSRRFIQSKAIIYSDHGEPKDTIKVHSYEIGKPQSDEMILKTVAHPINPSDINQIEGVYPSKPEKTTELGTQEPSAVCGNEGLLQVVEIGSSVTNVKVGDWVIPNFPNYGTWRTFAKGKSTDYIKIENQDNKLQKEAIATMSVNACTAYELLTTITKLNPGDWFIQNGGNSSVGRLAIQIGKKLGYNSINVVRNRDNIEDLKKELFALGATKVITEEENSSRDFSGSIKEWTKDSDGIKLALNAIGGSSSTGIARKLAPGGFFVTYGGMSKKPVVFPTSLFIFKNITAKGYWITRNNFANLEQKKHVVQEVLSMFRTGDLSAPDMHQNLVKSDLSDDEFLKLYLESLENAKKGKQLMVFE